MFKNFEIFAFFVIAIVFTGCQNSAIQPSAAAQSTAPETIQSEESQLVKFQGVSFRYNARVFGKVAAAEVDEYKLKQSDDKPDYVAPKHIAFTFDLRKQYNEANLKIYPVADFPKMMELNKPLKHATQKGFKDLRKVLTNKNLRIDGEIPFIPFRDGGQEFQAKVKLAKFENGKGVFFVTHWTFEVALISNELLYYVFEGLTDDGKYYVVAEMPTNVKFLPEHSPDDFEGYKRSFIFKDYRNPDQIEKRYIDYVSSITGRLNALASDEYQPSLNQLEEIISSLKIEK